MKARFSLLAAASLLIHPLGPSSWPRVKAPSARGGLRHPALNSTSARIPAKCPANCRASVRHLRQPSTAPQFSMPWAARPPACSVRQPGHITFQDLRFHGFEASPLQGVAQGIAVYQNGVRLNEAFGDTVNGRHPPNRDCPHGCVEQQSAVRGLNALGGSVNLVMKNGLPGRARPFPRRAALTAMAWARRSTALPTATSAFMARREAVADSGWRLHSPSILRDFMPMQAGAPATASCIWWRRVRSPAWAWWGRRPSNPLQQASDPAYTYPQTTHNLVGIGAEHNTRLSDNWQLEASVYVRTLRQRHVDGNDGNFEGCSSKSSFGGDLCLQDDDFWYTVGGKRSPSATKFVIMNGAGQVFPFDSSVNYAPSTAPSSTA